jgi:hypothetical protein
MVQLSFVILKHKGGAMRNDERGRVIAKYPQAIVRFHKAVYEFGRAEAKLPAHWQIVSATAGGIVLGTGMTEDAAWADAVKKL